MRFIHPSRPRPRNGPLESTRFAASAADPGRRDHRLRTSEGGALILAALAFLASVSCSSAANPGSGTEIERIAWIDSLNAAGLTDSALSVIDRSIAEADAAGDSSLLISLWLRQGRIQNAHGLVREAEEALKKATAAAWERGDTTNTCRALQTLTSAVVSQGRLAEARSIAERHLALSRSSGNREQEGWARVALGRDAWIQGRSDEAIEQCRRAIELFHEAGELSGEAWTQNGLGIALSGLGRYDEARKSFLAARRLADQCGEIMVQIQVANNLGALEFMLGDPAAAVEHFRESVRLNQRIGNIRDSIIPAANLARCNSDLGRWSEAADSLEIMLGVCRRQGYDDLAGIVMNRLADTRVAQGRVHEAMSLYRRVIELGDRATMKSRGDAARGLASGLADADSSAAALALLEKTLDALGDQGDPDLRVDIEMALGEMLLRTGSPGRAVIPLGHAERTAAKMAHASRRESALIGLARAYAGVGRPDSSRAVWERAARVWEDLRSLSSDPEWRETRGEWSRWLATELTALILARDPGPEAVRTAYERALRFKARTLLERMGGVAPSGAAPPESLTVERLQTEILKEGELLLDFFLGPTRSYLFAISPESCRVCVLPAEDLLAARVRLYGDLLRTPPVGAGSGELPDGNPAAGLDEAGSFLHVLLFHGVEDLLRSHQRIYVSPDGLLNILPFGLTGREGNSGPEWVRVPSAAILDLLRSREKRPTTSEPRILALAANTGRRDHLRGVVEEVDDLARRYKGVQTRFLGPLDTLRIADLVDAGDVLHVASHSRTDDERPWLSAFELGASRVPAAEIASSRISPRLAVLSSCQTQHGRVVSGEGVRGLSTALLCAGSDCVVATLWPVEDRTTAAFMGAFYDGLFAGRTVAGALQAAQQRIRAEPSTSHPFFWAGFVTIGLGDARVPLRPRAGTWPMAMAAAAAAATVLWSVRRRRFPRGAVIRAWRERLMG